MFSERVTLSAAKGLCHAWRFFASLRMTSTPGSATAQYTYRLAYPSSSRPTQNTAAPKARASSSCPIESTFSSPRRLGLVIDDLPAKAADVNEEKKGPRVGAPDQAVQGFLKSAGLTSIDQAQVVDRSARDLGCRLQPGHVLRQDIGHPAAEGVVDAAGTTGGDRDAILLRACGQREAASSSASGNLPRT